MSNPANNTTADQSPEKSQAVSFTLYYNEKLVTIDSTVAWLSVPKHLTAERLPRKLKLLAGIPVNKNVHVYRYSRVADSYVLLSSASEYAAMLRAVKVKKHLTFSIRDDDGKILPRLAIKSTVPLPKTEKTATEEDSVPKSASNTARDDLSTIIAKIDLTANLTDFLKSDECKQLVSQAIKESVSDQMVVIGSKIEEVLTKTVADLTAPFVKKYSTESTETQTKSAPSFQEEEHGEQQEEQFKETEKEEQTDETEKEESTTPIDSPYYHSATCDSCKRWISKYRYKCLWCSDYDLCTDCIDKKNLNHHNEHSFVRISSRDDIRSPSSFGSAIHRGILCDGPCCVSNKSYISGDRYTCTVCHDVDFCGKCANLDLWKHDPSHGLILRRSPTGTPITLATSGATKAEELLNENGTEYCALLTGFKYTFTTYGTMMWDLRNVGTKAWPKGTVMLPGFKTLDAKEISVTKPIIDKDVQPGESIRLWSDLHLAWDCHHVPRNEHDYASWRLETPEGVEFAQYKYYHGMNVSGGILLPGANEPATEKAATEEVGTEKTVSEEETVAEETIVEEVSMEVDSEENMEKKVAASLEENTFADLAGSATPVAQPVEPESATPVAQSVEPESATPVAQSVEHESSSVGEETSTDKGLDSSQVRLFEIPKESPSPDGSQLFPDGSQLTLSAQPPNVGPPLSCQMPLPRHADATESETEVFSETDSMDDFGDEYDVVNASDLSGDEM